MKNGNKRKEDENGEGKNREVEREEIGRKNRRSRILGRIKRNLIFKQKFKGNVRLRKERNNERRRLIKD